MNLYWLCSEISCECVNNDLNLPSLVLFSLSRDRLRSVPKEGEMVLHSIIGHSLYKVEHQWNTTLPNKNRR
ncbi:hypothetical protein VNO78_14851 [Psophocarpus tetragonolobus]|uniref:Uncharacterized protein n=1 Tax=Psophocarpus tetragonolobus TaxID=3891 RepID=A0AAN9SHI0_PSOTE